MLPSARGEGAPERLRCRSDGAAGRDDAVSANEFVRFMRAIAAPVNNMLANESPERRDEVWRAVEEATAQHAGSDGSVRLENEVIYLIARR